MARAYPNELPYRWLDPFIDGELGPEERSLVVQHLEQDPEFKAEYDRRMKMRALIREVCIEEGRRAVLDDVLPEVLRRIEAEPPGFGQRVRAWLERYRLGLASMWAPVGVAATVVVALFAGVLIVQSSRHQGAVRSSQVAGNSSQEGVATAPQNLPNETDVAGLARRPRHDESGFHKNEAYIMNYSADSGIVVIDVDPEGDLPAVVWHITEEPAESIIEGEPI